MRKIIFYQSLVFAVTMALAVGTYLLGRYHYKEPMVDAGVYAWFVSITCFITSSVSAKSFRIGLGAMAAAFAISCSLFLVFRFYPLTFTPQKDDYLCVYTIFIYSVVMFCFHLLVFTRENNFSFLKLLFLWSFASIFMAMAFSGLDNELVGSLFCIGIGMLVPIVISGISPATFTGHTIIIKK